MKMGFILLSLPILLFLLFFLWASYPWGLQPFKRDEFIGKIPYESQLDTPTTLTLLTWNIAYAYGHGSEGEGYEQKLKESFELKLQQIAEVIKRSHADIVFLQEVDFKAARSLHIDQLKVLSELTNLPYRAEAISWEAQYIPFPYLPIKNHFGAMKSGGGILSRYPLSQNKVNYLLKPTNRPWWYNLFYLYRYHQFVDVTIKNKKFTILNLHHEAFHQETREQQTKEILDVLKSSSIRFIAGDFNTTPSNAIKKSSFTGSTDDYVNDTSYEMLLQSGFKDVVDNVAYQAREDQFFTFPSHQPDRKLDYIFYHPEETLLSAEVLREGLGNVSDHLPLRAVFKLFDPEFIKD